MNACQGLNNVSDCLNRSLSGSLRGCRQSTLWISNSQGQPISDILIDETNAELVLHIQIRETKFVVLDMRATQETVMVSGEWIDFTSHKGFCGLSKFDSLIPLAHAVHPETLWFEIKPDGLSIHLAKQVSRDASLPSLTLPNTTQ